MAPGYTCWLKATRQARANIQTMQTHHALVEKTVLQFLKTRHEALASATPLPADLRVFDDGLLDSMALIEMVAAVESATGAEIDMLRFDPAAVDTASDLVERLVASIEV